MADSHLTTSRIALGALCFVALGIRVTHRELFAQLVPSQLEGYRTPVAVATQAALGVAGVSFLVPRLRPVARWTALGVLVGTLPEAVNQVRRPEAVREAGLPSDLSLGRVAVQTGLIAWVWRATRP